ncbi:ankyrin-1-like [Plakobranchus ocellatus]|uniref:Ankyrin-1-like n=1 Tax=Plakobranchus ocellatus TaxID=259542 RepID=A0AAV3ZEK4_9GAST|nr:ankyrin-1-like [Plakobranchus ocellatus]
MSQDSDLNYKNKLDLLMDAISLQFDSVDLKARLNKCDVNYIKHWKDKCGFDLLHYCILENNIVALVLLLSRGLFKPPHEPATWPYLHLAACLGHKSLIPTVVQELKYQNDALVPDWNAYDTQIQRKVQGHIPKLDAEERSKRLTPVDMAALFSHAACVRLLLDFWQVQSNNQNKRSLSRQDSSSSLYLSLACKANSPLALRVLLQEDPDKKEALECAIKMSAPECVDIVLRDGGLGDLSKVFQGMNMFHVLYSYSSCMSLKQYESMVEITSILLRHGQDVNSVRPSRTFPLYSLLSHHGAGCNMEQRGPFLLAALLLLLKAGADPNVDEILIERKLRDAEHSTAFGRRPYSSATHCLISNIPLLKANAFEDALVMDPVDNFCYKCIELLLRHGADLSYLGRFQPYLETSVFPPNTYCTGSVLHSLMSMRSVTFINYPILRLILHYGVDADICGSCLIPVISLKISYAINVLPFCLWSLYLVDQSARNLQKNAFISKTDVKHVLYVMRFMSQPALVLAYREFVSGVTFLQKHAEVNDGATSLLNELSDDNPVLTKLLQEYEAMTRVPWSLQKCCSHRVWVACRHHMGNIYSLPIPGPLRKVILSFY